MLQTKRVNYNKTFYKYFHFIGRLFCEIDKILTLHSLQKYSALGEPIYLGSKIPTEDNSRTLSGDSHVIASE